MSHKSTSFRSREKKHFVNKHKHMQVLIEIKKRRILSLYGEAHLEQNKILSSNKRSPGTHFTGE